jgi:hypothetical protein
MDNKFIAHTIRCPGHEEVHRSGVDVPIEHTAEVELPPQLNFIASIDTRRIEGHHRRSCRNEAL